jgi:hypothetical protein
VKRPDLEHLIRACGTIVDDHDVLVVGAQAVLGRHPNAWERVTLSDSADLIPKTWPDRYKLIAGTIGPGTAFREAFGYCARGVRLDELVLPEGWQERLASITSERTASTTGWCLEPHDIVIGKLAADRAQDHRFLTEMLAASYVARDLLLERLGKTTIEERLRALIRERIAT